MATFDRSRVTLAAAATGLARAATRVRDRVRQGARPVRPPIAEHQAVAFRLADMALRVDASRLLAWRAARMLDRGERATTEAAMAKLHASETAMSCTWGAVQTLGGWGYSREYPVEKWMRDAKLEEIEEGTSDIQRLVISRGILSVSGRAHVGLEVRDQLLVVGEQPALRDEPAARAGLRALDQRGVLGPDLVVEREEPGDPSSGASGREEVVEEAAAAVGATGQTGPIDRFAGPGWALTLSDGNSRWNWPCGDARRRRRSPGARG